MNLVLMNKVADPSNLSYFVIFFYLTFFLISKLNLILKLKLRNIFEKKTFN